MPRKPKPIKERHEPDNDPLPVGLAIDMQKALDCLTCGGIDYTEITEQDAQLLLQGVTHK